MRIHVYGFSVRNRPAAIALAAAALAVGAVVIAFGIVLLLALAAVATLLAAGGLLVRRLTGRLGRPEPAGGDLELDPSRQVFPVDRSAGELLPYEPSRSRSDEPG